VDPLGTTRSRVAVDHALITPDTHVWAPLPGWRGATAAVHISPALGARFTQATVVLEAEGASGPAATGVERFVFPLDGRLRLTIADASPHVLEPGDFAYLPAGRKHALAAAAPSRIILFEKPYVALAAIDPPEPVVGRVADADGTPFMGDEDARLQTLLPTDESFDMAVNVFTYQPGAALPQVEIHVMEHGLQMLDGAGVYRLGESWYPVQAGDVIWMRSYCPQWFVAMGKQPARYVYYKDVNRDPLRP
jgi:(S)-ureidoglycine aminohydrolase